MTGDPIRLPYQVYLERYGNDAFFDPDAKPVNRQRVENVRDQIILRSDRQFIHHIGGERYYALLMLVALRWLLKSRWGRFALGTFLLTIVATAFTRGAVPHYSAPVAGLGIGLVVQSLAIISSWIRWRVVATAFVAACLALYFHNNYSHFMRELSYWEYKRDASYVAKPPPVPIPDVHDLSKIEDRQLWERFSRWAILARPHHKRRLEEDGDRHLVVVKYAENSTRHREWVYNRADIDGSKIVWARWLDNRPLWPLLSHYPDRRGLADRARARSVDHAGLPGRRAPHLVPERARRGAQRPAAQRKRHRPRAPRGRRSGGAAVVSPGRAGLPAVAEGEDVHRRVPGAGGGRASPWDSVSPRASNPGRISASEGGSGWDATGVDSLSGSAPKRTTRCPDS